MRSTCQTGYLNQRQIIRFNQIVSQIVSQSVIQPVNRSIGQLASQLVSWSLDQSVIRSVSHSFIHLVRQSVCWSASLSEKTPVTDYSDRHHFGLTPKCWRPLKSDQLLTIFIHLKVQNTSQTLRMWPRVCGSTLRPKMLMLCFVY